MPKVTDKEIVELIKNHLLTNDEEFAKAYKANPPHIAAELQWQPGEVIVSELSTKDLIQLASRYTNDLVTFVKNILHFELRIEKLLTWLCEVNGIDVAAKFKEDAKIKQEQMEKQLAANKKALEEAAKDEENKA